MQPGHDARAKGIGRIADLLSYLRHRGQPMKWRPESKLRTDFDSEPEKLPTRVSVAAAALPDAGPEHLLRQRAICPSLQAPPSREFVADAFEKEIESGLSLNIVLNDGRMEIAGHVVSMHTAHS